MMFPNKDVIKKVKGLGLRPVRGDGVFLLIDEIKTETKTDAGIIVLDQTTVQNPMRYGTVISVGKDVRELKPDDRVVLGKYYGVAIPHDDSSVCKLLSISEDQVDMLIVDEE